MTKNVTRCAYGRLLLLVCVCVLLVGSANRSAKATSGGPVLLSEETSTRAIALESVVCLRESFSLTSSIPWSTDRRTRVVVFAMNLALQPGEDLSVVTADAEDGAHRHYDLAVEYLGPVPGQEWMTAVILRLNDNLGDVGDVLVQISSRGSASNRVRIAIGHMGGGPADDFGAVPTPPPSVQYLEAESGSVGSPIIIDRKSVV